MTNSITMVWKTVNERTLSKKYFNKEVIQNGYCM